MSIYEFINKHIATNYPNATEKEKTIVRTAVHLGFEFAKNSIFAEPSGIDELKKYVTHLNGCGVEQHEELKAMRKVPERYRNDIYWNDLKDMEASPLVCTCGLDQLLTPKPKEEKE